MNYKFLTLLDKVCEELDNEYDINSGGCCFVAACIAEELEKRNIPFLVGFDSEKYVKSYLECYTASHVVIIVNDFVINAGDFNINKIKN